MKIAAYLRVSTEQQKEDLQLDAIKHYCAFKGWINPALFVDKDSGSKTSRPEFDRMMSLVRQGEFDVVLCWKFDRIGRSSMHLIQLVEEFKSLKVEFVSIIEAIDTTTPMGKMIFTIFAALAEFERETLITRTKAGMKAAKDRGVHVGRRASISDIQVELIREDVATMGAKQAAKKHGIDRSSVYRVLKDRS